MLPIWHIQFHPPASLSHLERRERPAELKRLFSSHMDALAPCLADADVKVVRTNDYMLALAISATPEAVEQLRERIRAEHIEAVISKNNICAHA
ncbi:hypothetical protein [Singulisphaera sp. PoT]|uniref:hypothetical protein n=1 Tax=Singulisphaera sp. PoT TaxID=3411797 RepID=UPI003BF4D0E2